MVDTTSGNKSKLNLTLDLRLVCVLLLVVIAVMLAVWMPWQSEPSANARTITVTGDATVKHEPDVFVFSPMYETTDADKSASSQKVISKVNDVVAGLKKLGVPASKIKSDTSGYSNSYLDDTTQLYHYSSNVQVTIDVANKDLVQKVQDYLVSTEPTGALSPYSSFSDDLRKQLESKGRDKATKDAREKAEQSAKNLGFGLGKVKSINDGSGSSACLDFCTTDLKTTAAPAAGGDSMESLTVQPGEDEIHSSITVIYYVD